MTHRAKVKSTLGPLVAVANPLDYHTFIWNNEPAMTATFTAMVSGGFDLNMLVLDFPRGDRCSDADWWPTVNAFEAALKTNKAQRRDRRLDAGEPAGGTAGELFRRGIVPIHGIAEAIDAAEAAAFIGEAWARARWRRRLRAGVRVRGWRRGRGLPTAEVPHALTRPRPRRC